MNVVYIIGGIAVLIILFFLFGYFISSQERKNAPANLEKAKGEYEKENYLKAMELVSKAFYVPLSGEYKKEDASVALQVIQLLDLLLEKQGMTEAVFTAELKTSLEAAAAEGGEVDDSLTGPVEKFLQKFEEGTCSAASALMEKALEGEVEIKEKSGEDFTDLLDDKTETPAINKVGKMLMTGKIDKAISFIDTQIESASNPFRATLLEQRAACKFMKKDFIGARSDYETILEFYPGHRRTMDSLRDIK